MASVGIPKSLVSAIERVIAGKTPKINRIAQHYRHRLSTQTQADSCRLSHTPRYPPFESFSKAKREDWRLYQNAITKTANITVF